MSDPNHAIKKKARALAKAEGISYTTALRRLDGQQPQIDAAWQAIVQAAEQPNSKVYIYDPGRRYEQTVADLLPNDGIDYETSRDEWVGFYAEIGSEIEWRAGRLTGDPTAMPREVPDGEWKPIHLFVLDDIAPPTLRLLIEASAPDGQSIDRRIRFAPTIVTQHETLTGMDVCSRLFRVGEPVLARRSFNLGSGGQQPEVTPRNARIEKGDRLFLVDVDGSQVLVSVEISGQMAAGWHPAAWFSPAFVADEVHVMTSTPEAEALLRDAIKRSRRNPYRDPSPLDALRGIWQRPEDLGPWAHKSADHLDRSLILFRSQDGTPPAPPSERWYATGDRPYLIPSVLMLLRKVWQGRVTILPSGAHEVDDKPATSNDDAWLTILARDGYTQSPTLAPGDECARVSTTDLGSKTLTTLGADQDKFHDMSASEARALANQQASHGHTGEGGAPVSDEKWVPDPLPEPQQTTWRAPTRSDDYAEVKVGDKIRFTDSTDRRHWWTVRDRDDRYIVATKQAPFEPKGELLYTVVDLTGWQDKKYNGAGGGVVRSSLNIFGGGWDIGADGKGAETIIPALRSGEWELSHRRVVDARTIEVRTL